MALGGNMPAAIYEMSTLVVPLVIGVTFHEAAHGFIAYQLGDDTAWRLGRVTFNPLKHIDPFGTVILPALLFLTSGFLFGYAKPVPVDFRRLHHPRRDMVWVALAGPATNVLLALASSLLLYATAVMPGEVAVWVKESLEVSIFLNIVLCVFNMLPLPPLDGGRVAVGLLPNVLAYPLARLERFGLPIILLLFILPQLGAHFGLHLDVLGWLIGVPTQALVRFVLLITGHGG